MFFSNRIDRIKYLFDFDGEITEDVGAYFADTFDLYIPDEDLKNFPPPKPQKPYKALLTHCRDEVRILVAVARADTELHPREVEAIIEFCRSVGFAHGITLYHEDEQDLARYIRRQLPSPEMIEDLIAQHFEGPDCDPYALDTLIEAIDAVIQADGIIHENELALRDRTTRSRRTTIDLPFPKVPCDRDPQYSPIPNWRWRVDYTLRTALDMQFAEARSIWSVGNPRLYAFSAGTMIHHFNGLLSLQISAATPDTITAPGSVTYTPYHRHPANAAPTKGPSLTISQQDFAHCLQHGGLVDGDA